MPDNPDQQARGKSSCGRKPWPTHAAGDRCDARFFGKFRGRRLRLFASNRRGFEQGLFFSRSFFGRSEQDRVGGLELGKNGLAAPAAHNVFFPRIHFFGRERALMVGREHIGFRAMQILGAGAQVVEKEPAQNGVKLFVFFGSHPSISPS